MQMKCELRAELRCQKLGLSLGLRIAVKNEANAGTNVQKQENKFTNACTTVNTKIFTQIKQWQQMHTGVAKCRRCERRNLSFMYKCMYILWLHTVTLLAYVLCVCKSVSECWEVQLANRSVAWTNRSVMPAVLIKAKTCVCCHHTQKFIF